MPKRVATVAKRAIAKIITSSVASDAPKPAPATSNGQTPHRSAIQLRAYNKWMEAGRPPGDGVRFWLEAERELLQGQ
jgi:DUF2934 family protein